MIEQIAFHKRSKLYRSTKCFFLYFSCTYSWSDYWSSVDSYVLWESYLYFFFEIQTQPISKKLVAICRNVSKTDCLENES